MSLWWGSNSRLIDIYQLQVRPSTHFYTTPPSLVCWIRTEVKLANSYYTHIFNILLSVEIMSNGVKIAFEMSGNKLSNYFCENLHLSQCVKIYIYLSRLKYNYLSVLKYIYLSVLKFIYFSVLKYIYLSVLKYIYFSVFKYIYFSVFKYIYLSVLKYIYLSLLKSTFISAC